MVQCRSHIIVDLTTPRGVSWPRTLSWSKRKTVLNKSVCVILSSSFERFRQPRFVFKSIHKITHNAIKFTNIITIVIMIFATASRYMASRNAVQMVYWRSVEDASGVRMVKHSKLVLFKGKTNSSTLTDIVPPAIRPTAGIVGEL